MGFIQSNFQSKTPNTTPVGTLGTGWAVRSGASLEAKKHPQGFVTLMGSLQKTGVAVDGEAFLTLPQMLRPPITLIALVGIFNGTYTSTVTGIDAGTGVCGIFFTGAAPQQIYLNLFWHY